MSPTDLTNAALGRIGAKRINDIESDTDTSNEFKQAKLHYVPTRKALLRSFEWSFAKKRATLSQDTNTPNHEWTYAYLLPNDYLRLINVYYSTINDFSLEGNRILTDDTSVEIQYVADILDPEEWDDLFAELFVLRLAIKLLPALAGASDSESLYSNLYQELAALNSKARTICRQESNTTGRITWIQSRTSSERNDLSYS